MCPAPVSKCGVCNEQISKYKCPACYLRYCSLNCFKQHKEQNKCVQIGYSKDSDRTSADSIVNNNTEEDDSEDKVSEESLRKLAESSILQQHLQNPHLQTILKDLDGCKDPSSDIRKLMNEPLFAEFADECLKIVEPSKNVMLPE